MVLILQYFFAGFACSRVGPTAARFFMLQFPRLGMIPFPLVITLSVLLLLATPFLVTRVISLHTRNRLSDELWSRPTHKDNPFHFGNPLHFLHFAAYLLAAAGFGALTSSYLLGMYGILSGVATLAGIHFSMRMSKQQDDLSRRQGNMT